MNAHMDKREWVELFRETGLSEADMERWHRLFEKRHPEAHGAFLQWLGIADGDVEAIRKASRGDERPADF